MVTRPDLVFFSTVGVSRTAGACIQVSKLGSIVAHEKLTGVSVLVVEAFFALGFALLALAFVSVFLGAAAFFAVVALVVAFLGATDFLVAAALGLVSFFSALGFVSFLGAAGFFSASLGAFFASLTGPDEPVRISILKHVMGKIHTLWLLEFASLHSSSDSIVEEAVKACSCVVDIVVCPDIFLDCLTTRNTVSNDIA